MTDLTNQEKLEQVYEMTLENNNILRSLRKQQYIANTFRVFYWLIILGALGGVYYYIRPVLNGITNNSGKVEDTLNQFETIRGQLPETKVFNQFYDFLKGSVSTPLNSSANTPITETSTTSAQ
jgi:hypothetical protein